jgi:hypothetical protein
MKGVPAQLKHQDLEPRKQKTKTWLKVWKMRVGGKGKKGKEVQPFLVVLIASQLTDLLPQ